MPCRLCLRSEAQSILSVGELPVSNGYLRDGETAPVADLHLGYCANCDFFQLINPFPASVLAGMVPAWVRYGEPEDHLDLLCDELAACVLGPRNSVVGISYIDQSIVERLRKRGFHGGAEFDPAVSGPDAPNLENRMVALEQGTAESTNHDLIIARHIFDHVRDPKGFLGRIREQLSDAGRVLLEVPSSREFFDQSDALMLWESHANYFTASSLQTALVENGFEVEWIRHLRPNQSNVLVILGRKSSAQKMPSLKMPEVSQERVLAFVSAYSRRKEHLHLHFQSLVSEEKRIALLGAGHMGNLFLNLFDLGSYFIGAIDDDPRKAGLMLPGSRLPIVPQSELLKGGVNHIVLSVNAKSEAAVVRRIQEANGAMGLQFGSIFPGSTYAIP